VLDSADQAIHVVAEIGILLDHNAVARHEQTEGRRQLGGPAFS
jgi:hypothetical protein